MPKDPTRNKGNYEIRGGQVNEYEFQANQTRLEQEERERSASQTGARTNKEGGAATTGPRTDADRVASVMASAHEKAEQRKRKREQRATANEQMSEAGLGAALAAAAVVGGLLGYFVLGGDARSSSKRMKHTRKSKFRLRDKSGESTPLNEYQIRWRRMTERQRQSKSRLFAR